MGKIFEKDQNGGVLLCQIKKANKIKITTEIMKTITTIITIKTITIDS